MSSLQVHTSMVESIRHPKTKHTMRIPAKTKKKKTTTKRTNIYHTSLRRRTVSTLTQRSSWTLNMLVMCAFLCPEQVDRPATCASVSGPAIDSILSALFDLIYPWDLINLLEKWPRLLKILAKWFSENFSAAHGAGTDLEGKRKRPGRSIIYKHN